MNFKMPLLLCFSLILVSELLLAAPVVDQAGQWSESVGGLQARLIISQKPMVNGTSIVSVHLEIRNVSDIGNPMEVPVHPEKIKFTLLDSADKPVSESFLPRSGIGVQWGDLILPFDSSMRLGLTCYNVAIPKDERALIPLPSQDWVIKKGDKTTYCLKATISSEGENKSSKHIWLGLITTPTVVIKLRD